jgi:hypothetical protein
VSDSNPEEIEAQETRINTGFSTFGRIGGRPKESEKERPEGRFYFRGSNGEEKGRAVRRSGPQKKARMRPLHAKTRLSVRRAFSDRECFDKKKWWRKLHPRTNTLRVWTRFRVRGWERVVEGTEGRETDQQREAAADSPIQQATMRRRARRHLGAPRVVQIAVANWGVLEVASDEDARRALGGS